MRSWATLKTQGNSIDNGDAVFEEVIKNLKEQNNINYH